MQAHAHTHTHTKKREKQAAVANKRFNKLTAILCKFLLKETHTHTHTESELCILCSYHIVAVKATANYDH